MKIRIIIKIFGLILIAAGLFIIAGSLYINTRQLAMKKNAVTEFNNMVAERKATAQKSPAESPAESDASEPEESVTAAQSGEDVAEGDILYMLRIPSIDSENPVREGVSAGVLADSLGHEPDTAYIGEGGNCVIAGHRNYSFGSFFNRLNEVKIGDVIYVDTVSDSFTYVADEIMVVEPEDLSVLLPADEDILTLYTCTPLYIATHRLVIVAHRMTE